MDINNGVEGWHEVSPEWTEFINTPMNYADIRLFFGDQGKGKSITTVACVIDDVYQYANYAISPQGEMLKVRALNEKEQAYLESPTKQGGCGIIYDNLRHMRVFNDDETESKIIAIPSDYYILSPIKIFANRTFYGIRYAPFDLETFIAYINSDLMTNGWVVLSESVLIGKQDPTSHLSTFMKWFGAECRKRHLRMAVDMQYRNQLQPIFHLYSTTVVECDYDPETTTVTLDVNKNSPIMTSTDYISKKYRRFFKTDERTNIPQYKINRALDVVSV